MHAVNSWTLKGISCRYFLPSRLIALSQLKCIWCLVTFISRGCCILYSFNWNLKNRNPPLGGGYQLGMGGYSVGLSIRIKNAYLWMEWYYKGSALGWIWQHTVTSQNPFPIRWEMMTMRNYVSALEFTVSNFLRTLRSIRSLRYIVKLSYNLLNKFA